MNTLKLMRTLRKPKNYFLGYKLDETGYTDKTLLEIINDLKENKPKGYVFGERNDGRISSLATSDDPSIFHKVKKGYIRKNRLYYEIYEDKKGKKIYYIDGDYFNDNNSLNIKIKVFDCSII